MTKREIKAAQFTTLMDQVNALYTLDSKVYIETLEGETLATVVEVNPSKFTVSCSVVLDLGNGRQQTLMFTASDIVEKEVKEEEPQLVDAYEGLDTEQTAGDDLYLDPNFTVEGDDFVFEAHDDDGVDYLVRVSFDDVAAWFECPIELVNKNSKLQCENTKRQTVEACQQIVDRYQTGTTSYDVDIKRKKVESLEDSEYKCKGRKYKVLKQLSPYFGQTLKEVSILSIQGITKGVCFEVLQGGEWDEVSFLFSELEEQK